MKILIIGGTRFLGRALVEQILPKKYELTLFNRGKSNPDVFSDVEQITGDRNTEIEKLGDRTWDVVIDTCGYLPKQVKKSVEYLKDKTNYYLFISTISVYEETPEIGKTEEAEIIKLEDETTEDIPTHYGGLKALCEKEVLKVFGERAIIVRPGLIVGPHDPTHRFTYWPVRIRKGGQIIVPAGENPTQSIDVRDLAKFCLHLCETKQTGIYHATGETIDLLKLVNLIKPIVKFDGKIVPIGESWLLENKVNQWMELPLWLADEGGKASMDINISKAKQAGLTLRPIEETIKDTLNWYDSINGDEQKWPAGSIVEKEKELLERYNSK